MSLFDKILKLGEIPEGKVNEDGFYAVGREKISGEKVKEWSDMLRVGACPPELIVTEYFDWKDEIKVYPDLPKRPIDGVTSIEYKDITIAKFEDGKWQMYAPSLIEGIPPITPNEIPAIQNKRTIADPEKMQAIAKELDSLDALIAEQTSDIDNSGSTERNEHDEEI